MKRQTETRNSLSSKTARLGGKISSLARKTTVALVAGSALLFAAPFAAAQGTDTGWVFGGGTHIWAEVKAEDDVTETDIIVTGDGSGSHVGIATNQANKTFTFDSIDVDGDAQGEWDENVGFLYVTQAAKSPSVFAGTIEGGTINVETSMGSAFGVMFRDVNTTQTGSEPFGWWSTIGSAANIELGHISAQSSDSVNADGTVGAVGFMAGAFQGGTISIGSISTVAEGWTFGAAFQGNFNGSFEILDGLAASSLSNGEAIGFLASNITGGTISIAGEMDLSGFDPRLTSDFAIGVSTESVGPWSGAYGILVRDGGWQTQPGEGGTMSGGSIDVTGDIGVMAAGQSVAAGIAFVNGITGGNVTVDGDIYVGSGGVGAGFAAMGGGLAAGSTVDLGGVFVEAAGEAVGVRFGDGALSGQVAGKLLVDEIYVFSEVDNAIGVHVVGGGIANNGTTFGAIYANADNFLDDGASAYGIWTAGNSTFTLTGNVEAHSDGGDVAYGIFAQGSSATITVDAWAGEVFEAGVDLLREIDIFGHGADKNFGIFVNNNLTLTVKKGTSLYTDVEVHGTAFGLTIEENAELILTAANRSITTAVVNGTLDFEGINPSAGGYLIAELTGSTGEILSDDNLVISGTGTGSFGGDITVFGADLHITAGTFGGTLATDTSGDINITAGTFNGEVTTLGAGDINITAGTFNGEVTTLGTGDINITAGTFNDIVDSSGDVNVTSGTFNDLLYADNDVNITAGTFTGISAGNNMSIDMGVGGWGANAVRVTASDVYALGDLTVTGTGTANLGVIDVDNITIGADGAGSVTTIVGIDIWESSIEGVGTINSGGRLLALGNVSDEDIDDVEVGDTAANGSVFVFGTGATAANNFDGTKAIGANWGMEETGTTGEYQIVFLGFKDDLYMSAGFVQALTMHNNYSAWNAVRDRMISGNGFDSRSGFRGQMPCDPCNPCDPVSCFDGCGVDCSPRSFGRNASRSAWVNYTARSDAYASNFGGHNGRNWRLSAEGVQAGTDLFRSRNGQFGTLFGYEGVRMRNTGDLVKMDDLYVGFYGARVFRNGADVRGVFAYGWQDYNMNRIAADGGLYTSKFKGYTTETNLELGRRFVSINGILSLRPVVAVDVFNNNIKAATEAGGGGNAATYNRTSLTQVFFRTGTDLRYQVNNFTFNSGFYYSYDMNGQQLRTTGVVAGGPQMNLNGAKLGRELLTFNLGSDLQLTKSFSVFGGYQGAYAMDRTNSRVHSMGHVGAGFRW